MPIYEFQCEKCGHIFDKLVTSMSNKTLPPCPKCQGPTHKQISTFAALTDPTGPCGQKANACATPQPGGCAGGQCPFSQS